LQNLFLPKESLVNAPQKKKMGKEKQKKRGGEKAKGKRRKGSETFSKNSRNFAFWACPNFKICNLASGTKASPVLDL